MFNYFQGFKQGRQIRLECLSVKKMFINGQISVMCQGAEGGAGHLFLTSQGISSQVRSSLVLSGLDWSSKADPRVLSLTAAVHIHPRKKYTLK